MKTLEKNKAIVYRFNKEFIEDGNDAVFDEIVDPDFVYHTSSEEAPGGKEAYRHFFYGSLKHSISDLQVHIDDIMAEDDRVAIRKTYHGTLKTNAEETEDWCDTVGLVAMEIVRLKDGKFVEGWMIMDSNDVTLQTMAEEHAIY